MMIENKKCKNCDSNRFRFIARGYCKRCYPLIRKIEIVERWDLNNNNTLRHYPKDGIFYNTRDFKRIKIGYIEQFKERLSDLKLFERQLNSKVYGSDIVPKFQEIARLAGCRDRYFLWHEENLFDHNFTPKQKKLIYKILNDVTEPIPWKGINWHRIFSRK